MVDKEMLEAMVALIKPINDRLDTMNKRFDKIEQNMLEVKEEGRQTRVIAEHLDHNISLVAEQYTDIAKKLEAVSDVPNLRDRVRTLERVAENHTDQINELKKAQ